MRLHAIPGGLHPIGVGQQKLRQAVHFVAHTGPAAQAVEQAADAQGRARQALVPLRRHRCQQGRIATTLTVQLADVLRLGAAEFLQQQVGVVMHRFRVPLPRLARLAGRLGSISEAVRLQHLVNAMDKGGGVERRQQVVAAWIIGLVRSAKSPEDLLGQLVAARRAARLRHCGKGIGPAARLLRVITQSGQPVGVLRLRQRQQRLAFALQPQLQ